MYHVSTNLLLEFFRKKISQINLYYPTKTHRKETSQGRNENPESAGMISC